MSCGTKQVENHCARLSIWTKEIGYSTWLPTGNFAIWQDIVWDKIQAFFNVTMTHVMTREPSVISAKLLKYVVASATEE